MRHKLWSLNKKRGRGLRSGYPKEIWLYNKNCNFLNHINPLNRNEYHHHHHHLKRTLEFSEKIMSESERGSWYRWTDRDGYWRTLNISLARSGYLESIPSNISGDIGIIISWPLKDVELSGFAGYCYGYSTCDYCSSINNGGYLQTGHSFFFFSHSSKQKTWKKCLHLRILTSLFSPYPSKHITHIFSSLSLTLNPPSSPSLFCFKLSITPLLSLFSPLICCNSPYLQAPLISSLIYCSV